MSTKDSIYTEDNQDNYDDLRDKSYELIRNQLFKYKEFINNIDDIAFQLEEGIYKISKNEKNNMNLMKYTINTVKIVENLKSKYVIEQIKNNTWKPEDIPNLDKDTLNPEKWQQIQDIRLPKNIKKEMKKGLNKCKRCGSWYTEVTGSAQLRSADEPMTLFHNCLICDWRWKSN